MFCIGVAGGSGSGKTTFVEKIRQHVDHQRLGVLHMDSYYLPEPPDHLKIDGKGNFDHPEALDWKLIESHVRELLNGGQVRSPVYDFATNRRTSKTTTVGPVDVLIVEGIFALWHMSIRDLFEMKVFLHVESDIRFIRRLHRDVRERKREIDSIIKQYYDTVRPMHVQYLEGTSQYADMVVGEETDVAALTVAARIREVLSP